MTKDDFIFTVGYQGDTALVDKACKNKFKGLDTAELLEKGLFRAAFCCALYDNDEKNYELVLKAFNVNSEKKYSSVDELKRLFGVYKVPEGIKKVSLI